MSDLYPERDAYADGVGNTEPDADRDGDADAHAVLAPADADADADVGAQPLLSPQLPRVRICR